MKRVYLIDETGREVAEFPAGMTVEKARRELKRSSLAAHCSWKFKTVYTSPLDGKKCNCTSPSIPSMETL